MNQENICGLADSAHCSNSTVIQRTNEFFKSFPEHRKHSIYFPVEQYLSYYALFLVIIGTIFNITSFLIMIRKNIRKYACMRYLAVLSIVDMMVLYQWNFNTFFKYNLSSPPEFKDLEEISLFWCRTISYMAFSSLQLSSWILSLVSLDRVMIFYSHYWKMHMQKPTRINQVILLVCVGIFAINIHIIFKNGYVETVRNSTESNNNTEVSYVENIVCYKARNNKHYIFPNYERIHLALYNLIPFTIMLICNSLICYNVTSARKRFNSTKSKSSNQKIRRMTFMLFLVTFSFMILTLPSVIVHSFLRQFLIDKPYRRVVNMIVNNLLHTSHACNFLLYMFSAPNFRAELMKVIETCRKKNINAKNKSESSKRLRRIDKLNAPTITTNNLNNLLTVPNNNYVSDPSSFYKPNVSVSFPNNNKIIRESVIDQEKMAFIDR